MGTDLGAFFSAEKEQEKGPVFLREHMQAVSDGSRTYTIVLGRQRGVAVEMIDETIRPTKRNPPYETHKCDVAGYVMSSNLTLDVKRKSKQVLRPGDALYIRKGTEHRGFVDGEEPVRLVTVFHPARY